MENAPGRIITARTKKAAVIDPLHIPLFAQNLENLLTSDQLNAKRTELTTSEGGWVVQSWQIPEKGFLTIHTRARIDGNYHTMGYDLRLNTNLGYGVELSDNLGDGTDAIECKLDIRALPESVEEIHGAMVEYLQAESMEIQYDT